MHTGKRTRQNAGACTPLRGVRSPEPRHQALRHHLA